MTISDTVVEERQELPKETIGASYGDALLAAIAVGLMNPNVRWNAISTTVEPNAEAHAVYDTLYSIYRELYPATGTQVHALADLQGGESVIMTSEESRTLLPHRKPTPCTSTSKNVVDHIVRYRHL